MNIVDLLEIHTKLTVSQDLVDKIFYMRPLFSELDTQILRTNEVRLDIQKSLALKAV